MNKILKSYLIPKNQIAWILLVFVKHFLVIAFFLAARAAHFTGSEDMRSENDCFQVGNVNFTAVRALIIAGIMFQFHAVKETPERKQRAENQYSVFPECRLFLNAVNHREDNHQKKDSCDNSDDVFKVQKFLVKKFFLLFQLK